MPDLAETIPSRPTAARRTRSRCATGSSSPRRDGQAERHPLPIERNFKVGRRPAAGFYASIVGADACVKKPKTCDLSKGILADDAANTVTFKLSAPDPDLLQKLALPFAFVVPEGTPNKDVGTDPLPGDRAVHDHEVRPRLRDGVRAQPGLQGVVGGGPAGRLPGRDRDEDRAAARGREVTQVQNGQADWMYDTPPPTGSPSCARSTKSRCTSTRGPQIYYMALNTRVAPFDNKDVAPGRQLRHRPQRRWSSSSAARRWRRRRARSCRRTSPATSRTARTARTRASKWTAPDMAKAKQLVQESGTNGQEVTIIVHERRTTKRRRVLRLAPQRARLQGQRQGLSAASSTPTSRTRSNKVQMSYTHWFRTTRRRSNFLNILSRLRGLRAQQLDRARTSPASATRRSRRSGEAMSLGVDRPDAANKLWAGIDKGDDGRGAVGVTVHRQAARLRLHPARELPVQPGPTGWWLSHG